MINSLRFQAWCWGIMHTTGAQKRQLITWRCPISTQWVWMDSEKWIQLLITPRIICWEGVPNWLLHQYLRHIGWTEEQIDELSFDEMPF